MGWVSNTNPTGGIPMTIVDALLSAGPIKYFVETGTQGWRSIKDIYKLFEYKHSIELFPQRKEVPEWSDTKTFGWYGDSVMLLPEIITKLDGSTCLFWLDAHYSGAEPNNTGYPECPLIEEIRAIAKYKNSLIIIDDLRLFSGFAMHPLDDRQWPKIADIFHELRVAFPHHYTTVTDDYIISVPWNEFKDALDKEWRENFHIRYPSAEQKLKTEVKSVYESFKKYVE